MKSVNDNSYIETHRAKEDRRSFESLSKIPMIDIKGKIIQKDRRHIAGICPPGQPGAG